MYYCGNCGGSVSGTGRCPHCGALLRGMSNGSSTGKKLTKSNYKSAKRFAEHRKWEKAQDRKKAAQISKYGYEPIIGFKPTLVMTGVSVVGLVLSCFFSSLYLIMFGVGLILAFCLFLLHIVGCSSSSNGAHTSEAYWLWLSARVMLFGGFVVSGIVGGIYELDTPAWGNAIFAIFIAGIPLSIATWILNKKVFE